MERIHKERENHATDSDHVTQGRSMQVPAQTDTVSRIDNSPRLAAQCKQLTRMFGGTAQLQEAEEEMLQGKCDAAEKVTGSAAPLYAKVDPTTTMAGVPVNDDPGLENEADTMGAKALQCAAAPDEELPVQGTFEAGVAQKQGSGDKKPNNTGLPDNLKNGVEQLSGISLDEVKVHYNSEKPAQLNALAYAQGTDIHVGPGQERHLPHEAWHVVQQKLSGHAAGTAQRATVVEAEAKLKYKNGGSQRDKTNDAVVAAGVSGKGAGNKEARLRRHPQIVGMLANYNKPALEPATEVYKCAEPAALANAIDTVKSENKGKNAPTITELTVESKLKSCDDVPALTQANNNYYAGAQVGGQIRRCRTCVTLLGDGNPNVTTLPVPQDTDNLEWIT